MCSGAHIKYDIALKEKREAEQQEDETKKLEKMNLEKNRSLTQLSEEMGRKIMYSFRKFRIFDTFSEFTIFFLTNKFIKYF